MLEIIVYLITGFAALYLVAKVHIVRGEMKGYDVIGYWKRILKKISYNNGHNIMLLVLGVIIWPVRIIQFLLNEEEYFELYTTK